MTGRVARRGEFIILVAGEAMRGSWTWIGGGTLGTASSMEGIMLGIAGITGFICVLGEMIGRTVVGSKIGLAKRLEKRCS
jgi:hypothetical protein